MNRQYFFYLVQQLDAEGKVVKQWVQSAHDHRELLEEGWTLIFAKSTKDKKILIKARNSAGELGTFHVSHINDSERLYLHF